MLRKLGNFKSNIKIELNRIDLTLPNFNANNNWNPREFQPLTPDAETNNL
jgi:hypothetical protein